MRSIICLDGWRACAILFVIACHSQPDCNPAWLGKLGVDIFFGLSGFLITTLLLAESLAEGRIDLLAFYRRRAFRILPPALVFLTVIGLGGLFKTRLEVVAALFFFRNYLPIQHATYATAHLWSLAIEEQFYLLWPGLLVLAGAASMQRWIGHAALLIGLWRIYAASAPWASRSAWPGARNPSSASCWPCRPGWSAC